MNRRTWTFGHVQGVFSKPRVRAAFYRDFPPNASNTAKRPRLRQHTKPTQRCRMAVSTNILGRTMDTQFTCTRSGEQLNAIDILSVRAKGFFLAARKTGGLRRPAKRVLHLDHSLRYLMLTNRQTKPGRGEARLFMCNRSRWRSCASTQRDEGQRGCATHSMPQRWREQ